MSGCVCKASNRPQRVSVLNPLSRYCSSSSTAADYSSRGGAPSPHDWYNQPLAATGYTYQDRRTRLIYNRQDSFTNTSNRYRQVGGFNRDPPCELCSGGPGPEVTHFHVSTEYDRIKAVTSGRSSYHCKICKVYHNSGTPTTRNVLFASSTLINFWKDTEWVTPVHFDCEAIVGGTVGTGIRAYEILYGSNPTPMNVVIALGIHDILKGCTVHDIVQDLYSFQQIIQNHTKEYKHVELGLEKNSTVVLPTQLFRGQVCPNPKFQI